MSVKSETICYIIGSFHMQYTIRGHNTFALTSSSNINLNVGANNVDTVNSCEPAGYYINQSDY